MLHETFSVIFKHCAHFSISWILKPFFICTDKIGCHKPRPKLAWNTICHMHRPILRLFYDHHLTIFVLFFGWFCPTTGNDVHKSISTLSVLALWLFFAFWAEMGASWRLVCPSMVVTCPANFKVWFLLGKNGSRWPRRQDLLNFHVRLAIIRWQWTLNSYQSPLGCFLKGKKKKSFKISASYRLSVWRVSEGCKQTIFLVHG